MSDDGGVGARSFGEFLQILEDGRLNADLSEELRKLAEACNDHVLATMGPARAGLTLKLSFELRGGVFEIAAKFETQLPKIKRDRSVAWTNREGLFTPQNPRQGALPFGVREVPAAVDIRNV